MRFQPRLALLLSLGLGGELALTRAVVVGGNASESLLQPPTSCYRLALGAPAWMDAPVRQPALLEFRAGGTLPVASRLLDSLRLPEEGEARWETPGRDSLWASWTPNWLAGTLRLHLVREGITWRGRYAAFGHQVSDGRPVARGAALAVPVHCRNGRLVADSASRAAAQRLAVWRAADRPDTAAAVAEALAHFRGFLLRVPVHTLSLLNYEIASFVCIHGRLPRDLRTLRTAAERRTTTVAALLPLDSVSWMDAWGQQPRYRPAPPGYEVRSAGPDGRFETSDDLISAQRHPLQRDRSADCR